MDQVKTVLARALESVVMVWPTTSAALRCTTEVVVAAVVRTLQLELRVDSAEVVAAERTMALRQDFLVPMEQVEVAVAPSGPALQVALELSSFVGGLHQQHRRSP